MQQQIGRYQLIHKLATGGMAEVFLAKAAGPMGFEKLCVLKRILPHLASEPTFVDMFLSEARLAAQLNHPNIVQIFDFGEAEGCYFIAMEFIDGPNLREIVRRASSVSLALPLAFCARVVCAACEGLGFAHDFKDPATNLPMNVVHRDISPDNLLLSRQGAIKVVDFGIAKAAGQSPHTQTGVLKGKLAYMSPEQLRDESLDRRADVYALGVVLYELLTGLKPFMATSEAGMVQAILFEMQVPVVQRRPDVPEGLQHILARALAKERERRYPDCASFQAELEEFILSTGRPMGASQMALLVAMMTAGAEGVVPVMKTSNSLRSNPKPLPLLPPLETSSVKPSTDLASNVEGPPLAAAELNEERTSAARPSRLILRDASGAPQAAQPAPEPLPQPPPSQVVRRPEKDAAWVAGAGILLVLAGGGYLSQRIFRGDVSQQLPSRQATGSGSSEDLPGGVTHSPDAGTDMESKVQSDTPDAGAIASFSDAGTGVTPPPPPIKAPPKAQVAAKGTLDLLVVPEAMLYVDGWQLGQTRASSFPLEAGMHTLKLVNSTLGKTVERQITVIAGQTTYVDINLMKE